MKEYYEAIKVLVKASDVAHDEQLAGYSIRNNGDKESPGCYSSDPS